MKKICGKKQTGKPPSTGEAAFSCNAEKSEECDEFQCQGQPSEESYFSTKTLASGSLKSCSLYFDNPEFSERDSNIFSLSSQQNSTVSTSNSASNNLRQRKEMYSNDFIELENKFSVNEISACKSKALLRQKSEKRSRSHDSLDRLSNNLLLRKTDEISDFNFKKQNEITGMKENNIGCSVERLVLTKEKRPRRSDLFAPGTRVSLFSELDLIESQSGDCNQIDKTLLSCVPFRRKRVMKKRPTESQDKNKYQGFWSKKSFFNKARIVNFLLEKNQNTSKRSKLTQLNVTVKEEVKPKVYRERFAYLEVPLEEDLETKQYFRDLFFYIIYLILLTTIAMSMVSANMFYLTSITASLFLDSENTPSPNMSALREGTKYGYVKTLRHLHTVDDFWNFAESTMIDLFYWKFYYFDGKETDQTDSDLKKPFYENQIMGVPRIRQVRVTASSCSVHPDVKKFFKNCYYYYSPFTEETKPIKEGMNNSLTATAWVYTSATKLNSSYYWGEISIYGGGGYYLDLDKNKDKAILMIKELKKNVWISKPTRAVFIDFNIYNANANLFCLCKIVLEFPPVGGIIPKADFHALKLIRYLTILDFFILGCEFLLVLFAFYFTWKLIKKMSQWTTTFFLNFWNYMDFVIVSLLYAFIVLNIIRYLNTQQLIEMLDDRINEYTEFDSVKDLQINFNNVIAVLLFASWIKLLIFLTFNLIMLEFKKTLERSFKGILMFLPMFLTLYFAFAFLGNLLFGDQVKDYNTVWSSLLTLFQAFLGEFKYSQIQESSHILGPIFCVAFIFFIFFVFLNVFIAIINNAYSKIKSDVTMIRPKVSEYSKRGMLNLMTCCRPRKKLKKTVSLKKKLIFSEINKALENAGFTKDEIRIFLYKYNINYTNVLDDNVRRKLIEDLELKRINLDESARQSQLNSLRRRMENLNSRLENMEINLQPVIDKVDILLDRSSSKKYS